MSAREEGCSANRAGDTTESRVVTVLDAQESISRRILEDKEEGELSDSQISERVCMEIGMTCCHVSGCTRDTWNGLSGEQCFRTCKASSGKSHGPDCEESLNAAIPVAKMIAGINSKRVSLALLPSNSFNQGWVSWRDASGNLVMAEKQRPGSGAQNEGKNATASDEEDESHKNNFITITGAHNNGYSCLCKQNNAHACSKCYLHLFRIPSLQHMLQGVTRVDDPVASFDLCQEADVAAAVAGMIPVLEKSDNVSLAGSSSRLATRQESVRHRRPTTAASGTRQPPATRRYGVRGGRQVGGVFFLNCKKMTHVLELQQVMFVFIATQKSVWSNLIGHAT